MTLHSIKKQIIPKQKDTDISMDSTEQGIRYHSRKIAVSQGNDEGYFSLTAVFYLK